ncbi:MAG: hypothetical protein FD170_3941 [Bacteroidetes bacterium]|nr:MAG: hypothetical protein FD170_3941 [Bacteroidota bacterium]
MKTKLIALLFALALVAGCVKDDEQKPTKKGSKWGIIYRDSTHVDTIRCQREEDPDVRN